MIRVEMCTALPRPGPDRLVLYLLGPGFGESQVVAFPDGRWMVVDGCVRGRINMPLALLDHLGCTKVDLLAITHPDLDHIRGVPELIERFSPGLVWVYPGGRSLRNLLIRWTEGPPRAQNRRLVDLRKLHERLKEQLFEKNNVREVCATTRCWPSGQSAYRVHCIAPTDADQVRAGRLIDDIFIIQDEQVEIRRALQDELLGQRSPDDEPNLLSLALSVDWSGYRFLLAGDVESGGKSSFSGWHGVLDCLRQDDMLHLVTTLDLVKAAHHGSAGALHEPAWELHARDRNGAMAVLLTPFSRGKSPPPHDKVLAALRRHASHLGITANARGAFSRANEEAGWERIAGVPHPGRKTTGPVLAAVFASDGSLCLHAGDMAALFQQPRSPASSDLVQFV
jgi:hypothetical protein